MQTKNQLRETAEFLSALRFKDRNITLILNYAGESVSYRFILNGKVLFIGSDFKPSPLHG